MLEALSWHPQKLKRSLFRPEETDEFQRLSRTGVALGRPG